VQFMGFNINTIRLFIATLLLLIGQHTLAKTDIYGYVEGHKSDSPKNKQVTLKNTYLEAAGIGDRIMNLSHLDMTSGSIRISSHDRVLTQDFNLTNSSLKYTQLFSNNAQGNITLDHNNY